MFSFRELVAIGLGLWILYGGEDSGGGIQPLINSSPT